MFCINTPSRFVPFATVAGSPSRISTGSVISEPVPANVLMKPATKPAIGTAASSSTFWFIGPLSHAAAFAAL